MTLVDEYKDKEESQVHRLIGNAADIYHELAERGVVRCSHRPDLRARALMYVPSGLSATAADNCANPPGRV